MISEINKPADSKMALLSSHVGDHPSQKVLNEDPGLCHLSSP